MDAWQVVVIGVEVPVAHRGILVRALDYEFQKRFSPAKLPKTRLWPLLKKNKAALSYPEVVVQFEFSPLECRTNGVNCRHGTPHSKEA